MELIQALYVIAQNVGPAIAVVGALFGAGSAGYAVYFFRELKKSERRIYKLELEVEAAERLAATSAADKWEAEEQVRKFIEIVDAEESNIWPREPVSPPERYAQRMADSIPIMMLANLKGGVGKTTLAANLAGYFDARGERVLLIDLDYQGSLSATAIDDAHRRRADPAAVSLLTADDFPSHKLAGSANDSRVVDCYYAFANVETRLMLQWLAGRLADDVRYRMARLLLSPEVQGRYDRIIIDSPPRMTTGFVNGLCAATQLVIPTKLDRLAVEAVESFLISLRELKPALLRGLNGFRIVAMQKTAAGAPTIAERDAIDMLQRILDRRGHAREYFLDEAMVPMRAEFGQSAGQRIGYFHFSKIPEVIDPVGDRLGRFAPSRVREAA
jgi:chromosome partitioning protein